MTESGQGNDSENRGLLKDRGTLILFAMIIIVVIAGAAYGLSTQDDRLPPHSMDEVPPVPDGTYEYTMTVNLDNLKIPADILITFSDGDTTSASVDGTDVEPDTLDNIVSEIVESLKYASVDLGPEWTNGTDTTGTYVANCSFGTLIFSEDGHILNIENTSQGPLLTVNLNGWHEVETDVQS